MTNSFGSSISQARRQKGLSQRQLATKIGISFTYLSKLENNRVDYPPKTEIIKALSTELDLDFRQLTGLAGRVSAEDEHVFQELMKEHPEEMPVLLREIKNNPNIFKEILDNSD